MRFTYQPRRIKIVSPEVVTEDILNFCRSIVSNSTPIYIQHQPVAYGSLNNCFPIVEKQVQEHGGHAVNGWAIWFAEKLFLEAEAHSVWKTKDGQLINITPNDLINEKMLFLPDENLVYKGQQINNKRLKLYDDKKLDNYFRAFDRQFALLNEGERAFQSGEIRLSLDEAKLLKKINQEISDLGNVLAIIQESE